MNKKILITGASGFIGSFLVEKGLAEGYEVWAGIRPSSNKKYLQDKNINFIYLDFDDSKKLVKQLLAFRKQHGNIDYIIHNAGATKCLHKNDFYKINYQYTANLIDSLKDTNHQPNKFILMSSLSCMGKGDEKDYTPFSSEQKANPDTIYGKSKLMAENYLKTSGISYIILRPTGVYGPREKDYLMMVKTILSGINVSVGYKTQELTFIYIKDLINITFQSLSSDLINETLLISDGNSYTSQEYSNLLKAILNKKHLINIRIPLVILKLVALITEFATKFTRKIPTINLDKYKIMKQRNWKCDITPLLNDLKYKPQYNLENGLRETIEWYKKNNWI